MSVKQERTYWFLRTQGLRRLHNEDDHGLQAGELLFEGCKLLHRGMGNELAGFNHFQQRDWTMRASCVASHASAIFSKNTSQSMSSSKSNGSNLRLACFTHFCFQLTTCSLSSCRISIVHTPVRPSLHSLKMSLLCLHQ